MSSNIRLKKVCQHCHQPFIAKTTVTKFCSDDCAKRNYKKRLKDTKVTEAILNENQRVASTCSEEATIKLMPSTALDRLKREWLNMEDVSLLLGITQRTLLYEYGYLHYTPSYNHFLGSLVSLLNRDS